MSILTCTQWIKTTGKPMVYPMDKNIMPQKKRLVAKTPGGCWEHPQNPGPGTDRYPVCHQWSYPQIAGWWKQSWNILLKWRWWLAPFQENPQGLSWSFMKRVEYEIVGNSFLASKTLGCIQLAITGGYDFVMNPFFRYLTNKTWADCRYIFHRYIIIIYVCGYLCRIM